MFVISLYCFPCMSHVELSKEKKKKKKQNILDLLASYQTNCTFCGFFLIYRESLC